MDVLETGATCLFDGLVIAKRQRQLFEEVKAGGLWARTSPAPSGKVSTAPLQIADWKHRIIRSLRMWGLSGDQVERTAGKELDRTVGVGLGPEIVIVSNGRVNASWASSCKRLAA